MLHRELCFLSLGQTVLTTGAHSQAEDSKECLEVDWEHTFFGAVRKWWLPVAEICEVHSPKLGHALLGITNLQSFSLGSSSSEVCSQTSASCGMTLLGGPVLCLCPHSKITCLQQLFGVAVSVPPGPWSQRLLCSDYYTEVHIGRNHKHTVLIFYRRPLLWTSE